MEILSLRPFYLITTLIVNTHRMEDKLENWVDLLGFKLILKNHCILIFPKKILEESVNIELLMPTRIQLSPNSQTAKRHPAALKHFTFQNSIIAFAAFWHVSWRQI